MNEKFIVRGQVPYGLIYEPIFHDERVNTSMLAVYSYLCMRAGSKGSAWPSQNSIAKGTRLSRETVNRCLKKLENLGYVEIQHKYKADGSKDSNIYIVNSDVISNHNPCDIESHTMCSQITTHVTQNHININNEQYHRTLTKNSCCCSKEIRKNNNKENSINATTTTVINKINSICGTRYKVTKRVRDMISNLINSNYTIEDLNLVIDVKVKEFVEKGKLAMTKPGNLFGSIERFDELLQEASNNQMKVYSSSYANGKKEKKVIRPEWEENANKSYTEDLQAKKEAMQQLQQLRNKGAKEHE